MYRKDQAHEPTNSLPLLRIAVCDYDLPHPAAATETADTVAVATVGDDPIALANVKRTMESLPHGKDLTGDLLLMVQAQVLEENVKRWLVIAYARSTGDLPK